MIKVKFSQSKILIPVANGSTGAMSVTTPCTVLHLSVSNIPIFILTVVFSTQNIIFERCYFCSLWSISHS